MPHHACMHASLSRSMDPDSGSACLHAAALLITTTWSHEACLHSPSCSSSAHHPARGTDYPWHGYTHLSPTAYLAPTTHSMAWHGDMGYPPITYRLPSTDYPWHGMGIWDTHLSPTAYPAHMHSAACMRVRVSQMIDANPPCCSQMHL